MPNNTRQDVPSTQSFTHGDRRFVGIDTNLPPNMLDVGFVQDVDNLFVDGSALTPRPGWTLKDTVSGGLPVYALTPYRTADNTANRVFFVNGNTIRFCTSYTMALDGTTVTSSGTWTDPSKVRLKQHGKYVYGVPGDTGTAIFRIDGSVTPPTYETIPQLSAPTRDGSVYIKPKVTAIPNAVKTIGTQTRTVYASVGTGASNSTFTAASGTHPFSNGDQVVLASTIGTNLILNTTYLIYNKTATTFQLVTSGAPTTPLTNSTGSTAYTYVVKVDNQIDDYYTYNGLMAFSKPSNASWPSTWSNNLYKLSTGATSIPSGDFDGYTTGSQVGGTNNFSTDFSGLNCTVREMYSNATTLNLGTAVFDYRKGGSYYNKILTPASTQYSEWQSYPNISPTYTVKAVMCDGPEWFSQDISFLPQETWLPSTTATTMGLYYYTFWVFNNSTDQESTQESAKFTVTIQGLDSNGASVAGAVWAQTYAMGAPQSNSDWKKFEIIVDFRQFASSLSKIQIKTHALLATGTPRQLFFARCRFYAISSNPTASLEMTEAADKNGFNMVRGLQANPNIAPAYATHLQNKRIRIWCKNDSGAALDISAITALSFQWAWDAALKRPDGTYPSVSLGVGIGTSIQWSSIGEYDEDNKYMTFKLYTLSQSEKTNVDYLYVRFDNDVLVYSPSSPSGSQGVQGVSLFGIGNMTSDVGLSDGSIYEYAFTRWYPSSASGTGPDIQLPDGTYSKGFETPLSDISDTVSTTSALARVSVVLNPTDSNGYGSNVCIDKRKLVVASDNTDMEQWVSTFVPGSSQISIITNNNVSPSITYTPITGAAVTISGGSWVTVSAPDGTTYKKYTISTPGTNGIKFVSALATSGTLGNYWIEHYVPYGYATTTKYSHVCVYRRNNNLFPDGRFRLISVIQIADTGSGTSTGDGWSSSYNNATSREITLVDGVPDGNLLYQTTPYTQGWFFEISRDNLPLRATCIAVFQNRLWVSKDNQVFASWTIDQTDEHKIYTSFLPDLTEPGVQKKGFTFSVGGRQEKEIIRALLPVYSEGIVQSNTTSATMLVLKDNSVSTIIGFDPTTFNVQSWISTQGVGISAPLTAVNALGDLLWLGVNGVNQWVGGGVANKSLQLRKLLSLDPTMQGPTLDKAYYQQSIATVANNRLYLLSTASGASSANTKVYVFDAMVGGWMKWSTPSGVSFSSIATLSFGDDLQYVIAGDTTGRIFRLEGTVDNVSGTNLPINWSLTTRQHGQTYSEAPTYYQYNRPYQLDLHIQNTSAYSTTPGNSPFTVTWNVENQSGVYNVTTNPDGVSVSGTYEFPYASNRAVAIRNLGRDVKGSALQVRLSGASTGLFHIRAIHIHVYDGGIRR